MSFKTLLVHAEPEWGSGDAIAGALRVAELFGSHVVGVAAEAFQLADYAFVDGQLVQMLRDQVEIDLQTARDRFKGQLTGHAGGSTVLSEMDMPSQVMLRAASGCDLIVAHRVPAGSSPTNLCQPADLILETGVPVLVTPAGAPALDLRTVIVAWKDSREARRALADALPLLQRAEQVILLAVQDRDERVEARMNLDQVVQRLHRLGVKARGEVRAHGGAATGIVVEEAAADHKAGLIVAGAYSHNRLREWVLGGVTQHLLDGSSRYILFSR